MAQSKQTAAKAFYEVVFRGKPKVVRAFLGGLTLGAGHKGRIYYNFLEGVEHSGKAEALAELVGIRQTDCHVIVDAKLSALLKKLAKRISAEIGLEMTQHRKIRSASLDFCFQAYARKYDEEIMALLKKLPAGLKLRGFKHEVQEDPKAKGIEAYSAVHHFEAEGCGTLTGPVDLVIEARRAFAEYPLIQAEEIQLKLS